ncbi:MAG: radical SAM protein [Treponema sp.]
MNVGLQKTSLINYPQRVAAAVFLPGCNLRCPYCYNRELVCASVTEGPQKTGAHSTQNEYVSLEDVYAHIEKRKSVLSGIVFSGGEALLSPLLPDLIIRAKKAGLAVKLDTNGLLPDTLSALLHDKTLHPDMVALDIKTSLSRYDELGFNGYGCDSSVRQQPHSLLEKTLSLLRRIQQFDYPIAVEYRTVLVPPLVKEAEILAIADVLPAGAAWFLTSFLSGNCLNPAWNKIKAYTSSETEQLLHLAQTKIPSTRLR